MIIKNINFEDDFHNVKISDSADLKVGNAVVFRAFSSIEVTSNASLRLGDRVFFNDHCTLRCLKEVVIGKDTSFGDGVRIFDHNHKYSNHHYDKMSFNSEPIIIGENCWIGANVVILKGVTIGDNVIIGANCLIYKDIPSNSIVTQKEELIIRERPQTRYRCFTLTASDTLEQLMYLVEHLPEVNFQIAARTNISPYLESFEKYPNVSLYTQVYYDDLIQDLLENCDVYLDINHWGEVDQIVERALAIKKPVFAFDNVAHQSENTSYLVSSAQPEEMVSELRKYLQESIARDF